MIGRSSRPLTVQLPPEGSDRPSWIKVGAIALIGFAVGVVWPRLAGIRPGPSAPSELTASASMRAPETPVPSGSAVETEPAATAAPSASSEVAAVPLNNAPPAVLVPKGVVVSCKTADGEALKGQACGGVPGFDGSRSLASRSSRTAPGLKGCPGS